MGAGASMNTTDVSESQLLPIGAAIHGTPVCRCFIKESMPLDRGSCGDKAVGNLILMTIEGHEISTPVFIKKCSWEGRSEAIHYHQLARCAVPIPHQYGVILHPDGDEILFMERLTQIGFDHRNEAEWRQMLTLLAQFNTCEVTLDYLPHLHPYEQGGRIDGWWITGFNPFPPTIEEISTNLRACGVAESDLPDLSLAAHRLCEQVAALPTGLAHQDFLSDNLGWRGERAEMVVFDVHKNAIGPRFADVATFLGLPDWSTTATFLDELPSRREALIDHYLQEYARFGGGNVLLENFLEESTLQFWAHKVAILWWMAEQKHTERIEQVLNYLRAYTI
jgi:hypothetical protein